MRRFGKPLCSSKYRIKVKNRIATQSVLFIPALKGGAFRTLGKKGHTVSTGSHAGKMADNPSILGGCGLARHDGELRGKGIVPVVSHFDQDRRMALRYCRSGGLWSEPLPSGATFGGYDVVLDARDLLARVIALHTRRIRALYALRVHDQERAAGVAPVSLGPRQPDFFKKTLNRFLEAVYDLANDGSAKAK